MGRMEKQSQERRLHLFRHLFVLLPFPTCSLFLSFWPSCICAMSSPEQVGKEAVVLRQCVLQNTGQGKGSQKNILKAR